MFSLKISTLLKECLVDMLADFQETSSAMKDAHLRNCTYKQINKVVLSQLDKNIKDAENISYGFGLRMDFSNGYRQLFTTEVFSEHGLDGMIEAFHFECKDQVSPLRGSITDIICENECKSEINQLFTTHYERGR